MTNRTPSIRVNGTETYLLSSDIYALVNALVSLRQMQRPAMAAKILHEATSRRAGPPNILPHRGVGIPSAVYNLGLKSEEAELVTEDGQHAWEIAVCALGDLRRQAEAANMEVMV
jgi:hypothetical protein